MVHTLHSKYKSQSLTQSVSNIIYNMKEGKLDTELSYKRGIIWNNQMMSEFINSVMFSIVPNNLIFNNNINGHQEVIDGKQRIYSLVKFSKNKISVKYISNGKREYLYYNKVPKKYKSNSHYRSMNNIERNTLFDNRYMNIIVYENLSYKSQINIFNRIHQGNELTNNEKIFSVLQNKQTCMTFKKLCNDIDIVSKLNKFKNTQRYEHVSILLKIMYMIQNQTYSIPTEDILNKYIKYLDNDDLNDNMDKMKEIINICFSEKLLGHSSMIYHYDTLYLISCIFIKDKYKKNINSLIEDEDECELMRSAHRKIINFITTGDLSLSESNYNVEIIRKKLNLKLNRLRNELEYPTDDEDEEMLN